MTGRHVIHTGIYDPDCSWNTYLAVPPQFTFLPQHLKKLGYATFAVGKWHLGMYELICDHVLLFLIAAKALKLNTFGALM
jgi:arylsulfatase A-like enzyme